MPEGFHNGERHIWAENERGQRVLRNATERIIQKDNGRGCLTGLAIVVGSGALLSGAAYWTANELSAAGDTQPGFTGPVVPGESTVPLAAHELPLARDGVVYLGGSVLANVELAA
jgi:hypothetical protein